MSQMTQSKVSLTHKRGLFSLSNYRSAAPHAPVHSTEGRAADMNLDGIAVDGPKTTAWERRFSPYDFNGG